LQGRLAEAGGIYGNDAVAAMYPMTHVDAAGATLDGSKHKPVKQLLPALRVGGATVRWPISTRRAKGRIRALSISGC